MNRTQRAQFHDHARTLREACPAMYPVHVRLCAPREADLADTGLLGRGKRRHFLIRIRPELGYQFASYLLCHEWAHAVGWNPESHPSLADHDEVFGVHWSRTHRALFPDVAR